MFFARNGEGFTVHDGDDPQSGGTDFYARAELTPDLVTLLIDRNFVEPLIMGKRSDTTRESFKVHDVEGEPLDERTITGVMEVWLREAFFVFRFPNDDDALKLCRMIILSAWEHRHEVQASLLVWDD